MAKLSKPPSVCRRRRSPAIAALFVAHPLAGPPPLVRAKTGLVGHATGLGDVVAEVEVPEPPGSAQLRLAEDGKRAGAEPAELGIEVAVDGRHRLRAAIGHRHAHQPAADEVAQLERVATGIYQERAIALHGDRPFALIQLAAALVGVVKPHPL